MSFVLSALSRSQTIPDTFRICISTLRDSEESRNTSAVRRRSLIQLNNTCMMKSTDRVAIRGIHISSKETPFQISKIEFTKILGLDLNFNKLRYEVCQRWELNIWMIQEGRKHILINPKSFFFIHRLKICRSKSRSK